MCVGDSVLLVSAGAAGAAAAAAAAAGTAAAAAGTTAKVKGIQRFKREETEARWGQRAALRLTGVDASVLVRRQ